MYTGYSGVAIAGKSGVYDTPSGYAYGSRIYGQDPNSYVTFDTSKGTYVNGLGQAPTADYVKYRTEYIAYQQQQAAQAAAQQAALQQQQQQQQAAYNKSVGNLTNQGAQITNALAGQTKAITSALNNQPSIQDYLGQNPYLTQQYQAPSYAVSPPYQQGFYWPDVFSYYPKAQPSALPSSDSGAYVGGAASASFGGSSSGGISASGGVNAGGGGFGSLGE